MGHMWIIDRDYVADKEDGYRFPHFLDKRLIKKLDNGYGVRFQAFIKKELAYEGRITGDDIPPMQLLSEFRRVNNGVSLIKYEAKLDR